MSWLSDTLGGAWEGIKGGISDPFGEGIKEPIRIAATPFEGIARPFDQAFGTRLTPEVKRTLLPIIAGAAGSLLGPWGAAAGAGAARAAAGYEAGDPPESNWKNALYSGAMGYGGAAAAEGTGYGASTLLKKKGAESAIAGGAAGGGGISAAEFAEIEAAKAGGKEISIPLTESVAGGSGALYQGGLYEPTSTPKTATPQGATVNIGSNAKTGGGGMFSSPSINKLLIGSMLAGTAADYFGKKNEIEGQQKGIADYLSSFEKGTEWSEQDRQGMMTALSGAFSESMEAKKRRAAEAAAARGTGGGAYGKDVERIEREGRELIARSLAPTFGPSGQVPDISAFLGQNRSAGGETLQNLSGTAGNLASMYLLSQMFGGR